MAVLPQDATIDGEVVVCDAMAVADFELLHGREHDRRAFLYAFDLLELDGVDLRPFPLERAQESTPEPVVPLRERHPVQRSSRGRWGHGLRPCLPAWLRGHRQQGPIASLPIRAKQDLDQGQKSKSAGSAPVDRT
jgi:hypothetical protein